MLKTRDENSCHLWSLPEILHDWFQLFQPWCQLGNKRGKLPLAQTLLEQFVGESTQMVRGNTCECELLIIVAKLLWLRCSRHCYEKSLEENSSNRAVETRHAARQAAGNCQYLSVEVPERLVPSRRLLERAETENYGPGGQQTIRVMSALRRATCGSHSPNPLNSPCKPFSAKRL